MRFIVLFVLCFSSTLFAQDAYYSQYTNSRLTTNPAFAGTDSSLVLSAGYRNQWPKISSNYKTFYVSADQYFNFLKGGIGISFLNDDQGKGILKSSEINLIYSSHIQLLKGKLTVRPALQASYCGRKIDFSSLTFGDMIDARRGYVDSTNPTLLNDTKRFFDLSAGLLLYTNRFYLGAAMHHLTQPDVGFISPAKLPRRFTINAGANIALDSKKNFQISPNVLFMNQSSFNMYVLGLNFGYKKLLFGINFRKGDAAIFSIGFRNRLFRLNYSFDYTLYNFTVKETGGAHELQLLFYIHYHQKKKLEKTISLL